MATRLTRTMTQPMASRRAIGDRHPRFATRVAAVPSGPLPDLVPPTVALVSPSAGSSIASDTPITIDVTDDHGLAAKVLIAFFDTLNVAEVIHDGSAFVGNYQTSTSTPITGGTRFVIVRTPGWKASPRIRVVTVDTSGNFPL